LTAFVPSFWQARRAGLGRPFLEGILLEKIAVDPREDDVFVEFTEEDRSRL
jgi:hypothetical protein